MNDDPLPQTTFAAVLDELIPARGASLPGAGSLGVGAYVAAKLGDSTPFVASGLAALDALAREAGAAEFADLPPGERAPLLNEVEASQPGFVGCLLFHLYTWGVSRRIEKESPRLATPATIAIKPSSPTATARTIPATTIPPATSAENRVARVLAGS